MSKQTTAELLQWLEEVARTDGLWFEIDSEDARKLLELLKTKQ